MRSSVTPSDRDDPEQQLIQRETDRRAEPAHRRSLTDAVAEVMITGVAVTGAEATLQVGDPDVDPMENEATGDNLPGGSASTPDQNQIDDIGRAYGLTDEDNGELRTAEELVTKRDEHRWEDDPRSKDPV